MRERHRPDKMNRPGFFSDNSDAYILKPAAIEGLRNLGIEELKAIKLT